MKAKTKPEFWTLPMALAWIHLRDIPSPSDPYHSLATPARIEKLSAKVETDELAVSIRKDVKKPTEQWGANLYFSRSDLERLWPARTPPAPHFMDVSSSRVSVLGAAAMLRQGIADAHSN